MNTSILHLHSVAEDIWTSSYLSISLPSTPYCCQYSRTYLMFWLLLQPANETHSLYSCHIRISIINMLWLSSLSKPKAIVFGIKSIIYCLLNDLSLRPLLISFEYDLSLYAEIRRSTPSPYLMQIFRNHYRDVRNLLLE